MKYKHVICAIFIERPNRFIAICDIKGETVKAHVRNTGRCRELLIKGVKVEAKILAHVRGEKIMGVKMKAKKRHKKLFGHKQHYTEVEISKIASK